MRDITLEDTFYHDFTTRAFATGVPTTLAGTPVLSVLEENNATPITAGVSVSVDRASVTGLNEATIVATAANGYENGKGYSIYISTGTVGGVSVVGEVVGQFTIGSSAAAVDLANGTDGLGAIKTDTAAILVDTGTTLDGKIDTIDTNVDAILVDTAEIGAAGAGLTAIPWNSAWDAEVQSEVADALAVFWTSPATLVDLVWDEVLTGATHNVTNSSGRRLRQLEAGFVLHSGTAQAATSNTITLDTGASAIDDFYNHARVVIEENTGVEQERIIVDYVGSTKVATIAPPWITTPDATSEFVVEPALAHAETNSRTVTVGLAQAGTSSTITLSTSASATDDFYNKNVVMIDAGTGEGQERIITDYNGTTKVATIEPDWIVNPDTTSEYIVEEALCVADVFAISGDETAADNLELDYDGTGYAKTNSTIGTVTTLTGHTVQTGDSFARIGAPAGASVSADIAVIEGQTDDIGVAGAGLTDLGGMSTAMKAEINTEVVDVITVDAISEIAQGVPSATPNLADAVMLMYMALRNRLDVDTTATDHLEIYNDAGVVITKKVVTDDGTIYSEAKTITGP